MPVIRGESRFRPITPDAYSRLLAGISTELDGQTASGGPTIFEIPLSQSDRKDILVVWNDFRGIRAEDRTRVILEAYAGREVAVAHAMGATYGEAIQQQLLPYAVRPRNDEGGLAPEAVHSAMVREGAFVMTDGRLDLRFPSRRMATDALRRLETMFPDSHWEIGETFVMDADWS